MEGLIAYGVGHSFTWPVHLYLSARFLVSPRIGYILRRVGFFSVCIFMSISYVWQVQCFIYCMFVAMPCQHDDKSCHSCLIMTTWHVFVFVTISPPHILVAMLKVGYFIKLLMLSSITTVSTTLYIALISVFVRLEYLLYQHLGGARALRDGLR